MSIYIIYDDKKNLKNVTLFRTTWVLEIYLLMAFVIQNLLFLNFSVEGFPSEFKNYKLDIVYGNVASNNIAIKKFGKC